MGLMDSANSLNNSKHSNSSLVKDPNSSAKQKQIVIAGCGGIGSNVARFLIQAGFTNLLLIDFDKVVYSNLNRQFYRIKQKGKKKARMLKDNLLELLNFRDRKKAKIKFKVKRITKENVSNFLSGADILVEAFDVKENKKMLIEAASSNFPKLLVVAANGIGGTDCASVKVVKVTNNLTVVGDFKTDIDSYPVFGYKVSYVASLMTQIIISKLENDYANLI